MNKVGRRQRGSAASATEAVAGLRPPPWTERPYVAKAEHWAWPVGRHQKCAQQTLNATHYNCDRGGRQHTGKRCVDVSFGKQLLHLAHLAVVRRSSKRHPHAPAYETRFASWPASEDLWARHLHCGSMDAWVCMFGKATINPCCDTCLPRLSHALKSILLDGHRGSPLLTPGPFSRPAAAQLATRMNISVHVRGADSCAVVVNDRINTSHPYVSRSFVRQCVSFRVYLNELRRLEATYDVDQIFVSTDDAKAAALFSAHPKVRMRQFDRGVFNVDAMRSNTSGTFEETGADGWKHWIENRNLTGASGSEMVVSALEDFRFLAQGSYLLGSFCGTFTLVAWHLITALDGRPAPFTSVDGCTPVAMPVESSDGGPGSGHTLYVPMKRQHINGANRPTFLRECQQRNAKCDRVTGDAKQKQGAV